MNKYPNLRNSLYFYNLNKRLYSDGKFYCFGTKIQAGDL